MWKAAFTGRSEKGGGGGGGDTASATGRSEVRRKKSSRSERGDRDDDARSVMSTVSRRHGEERSERRRRGSQYDDGRSSFFSPSSASYATAPTSRAGVPETTRQLTESALRMLPDDDEAGWEDEEKDMKSERRQRKHRGSGSSDEHEKRRKSSGKDKERKRSSSPEKSRSKKKSAARSSDKKDKSLRKIEPDLVQESSRAIPAQGSFEQFPGQYAGGVMGGHPEYSMSGALPSAVPKSQFPGEEVAPYSQSEPQAGISRADSYGAAAEYYLDEGQSVHHQPGARPKSPNMLVNKDMHLISASAVASPAHDTGNGSAADFYNSGMNAVQQDTPAKQQKLYSASAHTTPAKPPRPGKQFPYSDSKPRPSKTGRTSSASAIAAGFGTAEGVSALGRMSGGRTSSSQYHSHFEQQTSSGYQTSTHSGYPPTNHSAGGQVRPSQHTSDENVFYASPSTMNAAESSAYGVLGSHQGGGMYSEKQSTHSHAGLYGAGVGAGAAAAGLAAHGMSHHGRADLNMSAAGGIGGGGHGPPSNYGVGGGYYHPGGNSAGGSMMQQGRFHEHKGPMTKLKDGLLNLISTPEDVAKMEMYTEYIGVCKHCFDPRTSAWDAPRVHHYHGKNARRQDSFESIRRRLSNEKLRRKVSHERVDKESRYYAPESSRRRREDRHSCVGLAGAGLAAAGAAPAAGMMFNERKNFDDTYSVKSGHRESSAIRRRSRSSSREQRRRSQYGTVRHDQDEYIAVRRSDGTTERRRRSRSSDGKSRLNFGTAAAAGAALGAASMAVSSRRRSKSPSEDKRRRSGRSEYSPGRRPTESGGLFGFFSPPAKPRRGSREHQKKRKGFFSFSNGSSSSSNSELAFGDRFTSINGSKTSLNSGLRRKSSTKSNRGRSRRNSDEHFAATIDGIGITAAALAAAQRGGRITKRQSRPELGAKRHVRQHVHGSPGSSDEDWEDELSSADDDSSVDGRLAFGDYDGKRLSTRQSHESVASQSSAGGLGAWGWRWGGKDKKGRKARRSASIVQQFPATSHGPVAVPGGTALAALGASASGMDTTRPLNRPVYLDDTGRPLPSVDDIYSTSSAHQPLEFVDPAPISETPSTPGSRHQSMPGAFDMVDAPIYRPAAGRIQQPQPYSPAKPAFTQPGADQAYTVAAGPPDRPDMHSRTQSNPVQTSWGDAALIGAGVLGAGAIIAGSALSSGRKTKDQGRVSFGFTDEQQRKQDREIQREADKKADEERRRLDRTRALKDEAERSAKEARQEEVRRAREEEIQRVAQAQLDRQREQERKDAEDAKARAEQRAREDRERQREIERLEKEAKDRQEAAAAATAEFERQRRLREDAERQQAEYEQQRRDREDAYQRDQYRLAEEAQRQDAQQRQWDAERYARQYQDAQHRSRERSSSQKQSSGPSAWAPIAGAAAAVTVGAVVADSAREKRGKNDGGEISPPSRRRPQTSVDFGGARDGIEYRDGYIAREVTPPQLRDGEQFTDEDVFDPSYFKRKPHSASDTARHEELARKAAAKVVADRREAYLPEQHPKESYADFFAPEVKDIISKQPGEKQRSTDPDSDVQVWHTEVDDDDTLPRGRAKMSGRSKYAPYGVPSLYVIAPTPPLGSSPNRSTRSSRGASPLADYHDVNAERHYSPESKDSDKSERSRSISWGEDKTHVYDVQTPESYQERDSYVTSPDLTAAGFASAAATAGAALNDIVVDHGDKEIVYGEDEFSPSSSKKEPKKDKKNSKSSALERDDDVQDIAWTPYEEPLKPFYRQPYFDSVSDFSGIRLDSPGTEGAPPVRGFVEGETDEPTPVEEKRQHIPGGFDEGDANDIYRSGVQEEEPAATVGASSEPAAEESSWEPPLSKKEKKKRDKAAKAISLADREPSTDTAVDLTSSVEVTESAWEPPLSEKERKKRDKAAKRRSLGDSGPPTLVAESDVPIAHESEKAAEDDDFFSKLSKKDKKKRDKAAKKAGFADLVSEMSTPSWTGDTVVSGDTLVPLSRQESPRDVLTEQRRSEEKEAESKKKFSSSGFSLANVTDTILASGSIAAAAAALSDNHFEESPSGSSKKDKKKKKKKSKLGESSYDDPRDSFSTPEETARSDPSGMPGGWDSPEHRSPIDGDEQDNSRDSYGPEVKDEASIANPEPPAASKRETDPWSGWSEPASSKKSKKKSKRNSAAFDSIPQVSSPLRSEVAWDDYVGSSAQTNGDHKTESEAARSDPITVVECKSSKDEYRQRKSSDERSRKSSNDDGDERSRRSGDHFDTGRQVSESPPRESPDEIRSVASAPTGNRRSRGEESGRNSDYFDQPDYAYETQSMAASEPAEHNEGRRKHKRRSKHEYDDATSVVSSSRRSSRHADDDDNMSVISSRSRREKEEGSSAKKDKKGIFSNLFSRKSFDGSSSKDGASLSRSSTKGDDNEERRRRKKSSRETEHGDDDDGTRSAKSSSRRHRSEDDSKERRRNSTRDDNGEHRSESGSKHHRRRKTDEEDSDNATSDKYHRRRRTDEDADQPFLGIRVEELPPLPVSDSETPDAAVERMDGRPLEADSETELMLSNEPEVTGTCEGQVKDAESVTPATARSLQRLSSSTTVPLKFPFGHAPVTPTGKDRTSSFGSPVLGGPTNSATASPVTPTSGRSRQNRPHSSDFKSGYMPLYLVERNRQTPEVEDTLPSLPSSKPSSRSSSIHGSDDYQSAAEELEVDETDFGRRRSLTLDTAGANETGKLEEDYLNSQETTPKASEFPQTAIPWADPSSFAASPESVKKFKQEPQFYTWEDFAREEALHEQAASETAKRDVGDERARSESPSKHSELKAAAVVAVLGTAAVCAGHKLANRASERESQWQGPYPSAASHSHPLHPPLQDGVTKEVDDDFSTATPAKKTKKKGKKGKELEVDSPAFDEPNAIASRGQDPATDLAGNVPAHERTYEEPRNESLQLQSHVYASSAAHTLPIYTTDGTPCRGIEEDQTRPTTAYKLPQTESEPAPLVLDERSVQIGDKAGEDAPTPRPTRKQSKKASKKSKRSSTMIGEDVLDGAEKESTDPQNAPNSMPRVNFGLIDFNSVAADTATAWVVLQADAFRESMQMTAALEGVEENAPAPESRDLSASGDADNQLETSGDLSALPSSKKKAKKGDKSKQSTGQESEPAVSQVTDAEALCEDPEIMIEQHESNREVQIDVGALETPTAETVTEAPVQLFPIVSKKKSKKDKKKSKASIWEDEYPGDPSEEVAAQSSGPYTIEQTHVETVLSVEEPVVAAEDDLPPMSSKKKSKKDKKKTQVFPGRTNDPPTSREQDVADETPFDALDDETVEVARQILKEPTEKPVEQKMLAERSDGDEVKDLISAMSSKKRKKDKKKAKFWDDDEPQTPPQEQEVPPEAPLGVLDPETAEVAQEILGESVENPVKETSTRGEIKPDEDDVARVSLKKSEKDEKKRSALSLDAEPAESRQVDRDTGSAAPSGEPLAADDWENQQPSRKDIAAVQDTSSAHTAEQTQRDDLWSMPSSSRKSKKDKKKKKTFSLDEEEQSTFETPVPELAIESQPEQVESQVQEATAPSTTVGEDYIADTGTVEATLSRKQSKKEKKKKKQQSLWDEEFESAAPEKPTEPANVIESQSPQIEKLFTEDNNPTLASEDRSAPESAIHEQPALSRKQSKKDKKKQRLGHWNSELSEEQVATAQDDAQSADVEAGVEPQHTARTEHEPAEADAPPPETPDESFHDAEDLKEPTGTDIWHDVEEMSQDVQQPSDVPMSAETVVKRSWADEMDEMDALQSMEDSAAQSNTPDDVYGQLDAEAPDAGKPQDFLADRGMEYEPERATEDMDAFGEPTPRDPAEWSLSSKKPGKKGKKGRKSISAATPVIAAAGIAGVAATLPGQDVHEKVEQPNVQANVEEEQPEAPYEDVPATQDMRESTENSLPTNVPAVEEVGVRDESPSIQTEGQAEPSATQEKQPDEFSWAVPTKRKKGKKGKKTSDSEADIPFNEELKPLPDAPDHATHDVGSREAAEESRTSSDQVTTADVIDLSWGPVSKKDKKKAKKAKQSDISTPILEEPHTTVLTAADIETTNSAVQEADGSMIQERTARNDALTDPDAAADEASNAGQARTLTAADEPDEFAWGSMSKKDKKKAKKAKKSGSFTPAIEEPQPEIAEGSPAEHRAIFSKEEAREVDPVANILPDNGFANTTDEPLQAPTAADGPDEFTWAPKTKKDKKKAKKAAKNTGDTSPKEPAADEGTGAEICDDLHDIARIEETTVNDNAEESVIEDVAAAPQDADEFTWAPISKKDRKRAKKAKRSGSEEQEQPTDDVFEAKGGSVENARTRLSSAPDAPEIFGAQNTTDKVKLPGEPPAITDESLQSLPEQVEDVTVLIEAQPASDSLPAAEPEDDFLGFSIKKKKGKKVKMSQKSEIVSIEDDETTVSTAAAGDNATERSVSLDGPVTSTPNVPDLGDGVADSPDLSWSTSSKEKDKKSNNGRRSSNDSTQVDDAAATSNTASHDGTTEQNQLERIKTLENSTAEHSAQATPVNEADNSGPPTRDAQGPTQSAAASKEERDDVSERSAAKLQDNVSEIIMPADEPTVGISQDPTSKWPAHEAEKASQPIGSTTEDFFDMATSKEKEGEQGNNMETEPDKIQIQERTFGGVTLSSHDEKPVEQALSNEPGPIISASVEHVENNAAPADDIWTLPTSGKKKGKKAKMLTSRSEEPAGPNGESQISQLCPSTTEDAAGHDDDPLQIEPLIKAEVPAREAELRPNEQSLGNEKMDEATDGWFAPPSSKKRKKAKKNAQESIVAGDVDSFSTPLGDLTSDPGCIIAQEPADINAVSGVIAEAAIEADEIFQPATGKNKGKKGKKAQLSSANEAWTAVTQENSRLAFEKVGDVQTRSTNELPAPVEPTTVTNDETPREPELEQSALVAVTPMRDSQGTAAEVFCAAPAKGKKAKKAKKGKQLSFDYFADESKTVDEMNRSAAEAGTQAETGLDGSSAVAQSSPTEPLSAGEGASRPEASSLEADRAPFAQDTRSPTQDGTTAPAAIPTASASETFSSAAYEAHNERAIDEDETSFTLKKSKKGNKKAKEDRRSTLNSCEETTGQGDVKADNTATIGAIAAVPAAVATIAATKLDGEAAPEPAVDEWSAFAGKKSKKDKKAKKMGSSTPAFQLGDDVPPTHDDARDRELPVVRDEESIAIGLDGSEQPSVEAQSRNTIYEPELTEPTEISSPWDVEQSRATEATRAPSRSSHTGSDIDFTATVAAGLADSGFDPEMVINNPLFQRRASPTGVAEADPEEVFATATSKRKSTKKTKESVEFQESEASEPPKDTAASPQVPMKNELDDLVNQTLQSTGFDPALLEKASSDLNDEPEFSFKMTKRKKSKKSKEIQDPPTTDNVDSVQPAASSNALENTPLPDTELPPVAASSSRDQPADASLEQTSAADKPENAWLVQDEMDVDAMDRAYKAYKKNKRQQKKLKAAAKNAGISDTLESAMDDTGRSAALSDVDAIASSMPIDGKEADELQASSSPGQRSLVSSTFPKLEGETSPSSEKTTEDQRPSSGSQSRGLLQTSEVSQHLPTEVLRSHERSSTWDAVHGEDARYRDDSPSALASVAKLAAGLAAAGAGVLAFSASDTHSSDKAQAQESNESTWSFNALEGGRPRSPSVNDREPNPVRDSGYESTAKRTSQQTDRSSRELPINDVPDIVRPSSSRDGLRERRSMEPLRVATPERPDWSLHAPKQRSADGHQRTSSDGTPLNPTSKDRVSYLFQSPPDNLAEATSSWTATPRQHVDEHFNTRSVEPDRDTAGYEDRVHSTLSPTSPREPLYAIPEEHGRRAHSRKRSKAQAEVGGPDHIKAIKRTATPQEIRAQEQALSPTARLAASSGTGWASSNPMSTSDEVYNRLSWPAVDQENDTVNLDRSLSSQPPRAGVLKTPDLRSSSVVSNKSNTSGAQFRSAQELRSYSRTSNRSDTPSLRRTSLSGDLRAASRRGDGSGSSVSGARSSPQTIPFEAPPTPPPNDDELINGSASRAVDMNDDVFGYGDAQQSQVSPTRPPSVRKRQSMHINDLEARMNQLVAENRALQEAKQASERLDRNLDEQSIQEALDARDLELQAKDAEISQIKSMLQPLQDEIARLSAINGELTEANRNLVDDTNGRYATLQAEHQTTQRELESVRHEHDRISSGMRDIVEAEIANSLADKNAEILRLREQLDIAAEQIRALQVQIQSSKSSDFLQQRDEDYFDGSCQKLCQHVQQWVLRFSKMSDNRVCRLSTDLNDDKLETRLDNAVLDGSDVDKLLGDRVRRRDVFMSVVMTMVWEYIFTRYLFGMDREQRQKLKALEKVLADVGPPRAVAHWRATTLTLLSKRPQFEEQCAMDTEAVAHEIFGVLCLLLPPPLAVKDQLQSSLQKVLGIAVDLAIEMRTQRAEYIMLPPLQPEYDTNGDLVRKVYFNASLMNERSGFFGSNEELAAKHAVVKIVLFPLVVKKGDDIGEGDDEIVVCPAQVLVQNDGTRDKKVVRVMSGAMEIDDPIRSRSRMSGMSEVPAGSTSF